VEVTSPHGRIIVQTKLMDGVNRDTVWTWNAIGKRSGAWNLAPDAAEARRGFLLNHLIPEVLPADREGGRHANADPVTGQAAWFDLRVRIAKSTARQMAPQFTAQAQPPGLAARPSILRYGARFRAAVKGS